MFRRDSAQGAVASLKNTARFVALTVGLATVSACGTAPETVVAPIVPPVDTTLNRSTVSALRPTAAMPTGTARYAGQVATTTLWDDYVPKSGGLVTGEVVVYSADLALNANFSTNTISATLTNEKGSATQTYTPTGGTATQRTSDYTFNGVTSGNGTIAGNVFVATLGGSHTVVGTDFDGSTLNNAGNATVNIGGLFVGTNADGIYGIKSGSGVNGVGYTYVQELWGAKQ